MFSLVNGLPSTISFGPPLPSFDPTLVLCRCTTPRCRACGSYSSSPSPTDPPPCGHGWQPGLSVLAREVSMHAWGLRLRRVATRLAFSHAALSPSGMADTVGSLIGLFRSSLFRVTLPAYTPVQRFKCALTVRPHMARGQDGSLLLSCMTLSFTTSRRFIPTYPDAIQPRLAAP